MSNHIMSPLAPFTLESLVAAGQWTAAQNSRKKAEAKSSEKKRPSGSNPSDKASKSTL